MFRARLSVLYVIHVFPFIVWICFLTHVAVHTRIQLVDQLGVMRAGVDVARAMGVGAGSVATSVTRSRRSHVDGTLLGVVDNTSAMTAGADLCSAHCRSVSIGSSLLGSHH